MAATSAARRDRAGARRRSLWLLVLCASVSRAAVLPEDRADLMYHHYDGGGVKVSGPALLVQKSFAEKFSLSASYYVDNISSASVDVVTTASPFRETRTEHRAGVEYLDGNSAVSLNFTRSDEPDYAAQSFSLGTSHELFGGMTTLSFGYTRGKDDVSRTDSDFQDTVDRHQYRLGWSQVLTRRLVASANYEAVTEDGFLHSPYRSARLQGAFVPERYPQTRNSHAWSLRGVYALSEADGKPTSSLHVGARLFRDSWDIGASEVELTYLRYLKPDWIGEVTLRRYRQNAASFYSDNFDTEYLYMARDKELSTFTSRSIGAKVTWRFHGAAQDMFRCALSVSASRIFFDYDDFTDVRTGDLLSFDADVVHAFLTLWF